MGNRREERWERKTLVAINAPVWRVLEEERLKSTHIQPSRKKRNDERLRRYQEKLLFTKEQHEEHATQHNEAGSLPSIQVEAMHKDMVYMGEKRVVPIGPGEAWRLQQRRDMYEIGNPSVWGHMYGAESEIYRKHRHTDDVGVLQAIEQRLGRVSKYSK